jgi:hypothetical protein
VLIESFEGYTPPTDSDYKSLLEKLSSREEEIQVLKLEMNELHKQLKEQLDSNQHIKKTIIEHKTIHQELADVHDDKIMELTDELQRVNLENESMRREQSRMKDQLNIREVKIEEIERKFAELTEKYGREFSQKQTHQSQNMQDLNELKGLVDKKKEECVKLNKQLNKLKGENSKLKENNAKLQQTQKSDASILRNLENTIDKLKKSHEDFAKEVEVKLNSYAKLVEDLEKELSRPQPNVVKFIEIIKTRPEVIKKKEEETVEGVSDNEGEIRQKPALASLEEYADLFSSNRRIDFDFHPEMMEQNNFDYQDNKNQFWAKLESNQASNFDTIAFNQPGEITKQESQDFEKMLENAGQHLSMDEDDDPTIEFPKVNRRKVSYTEPVEELDIEKKMDEILSKPKPNDPRDSMVIPMSDSKLETNIDDVKQKLDALITKRLTITKNSRNDIVDTSKFTYENHALAQTLHSVVEMKDTPPSLRQLPSEVKISQIKEDTAIDMDTFLTFIEFLENYLAGPKNPTTLTLTDYERGNMVRKFAESEKKDFRKFFVIIMKYFLEYINFEEGQISNLIHANSYLEIKVENMKSEFNFLLKNFIDKNQKSQQFLNDLNINFSQLKDSNRSKLYNYRENISKRESITKAKHKANEDTPDNKKATQRNNIEASAKGKPQNVSKREVETEKRQSGRHSKQGIQVKPRDRTSLEVISEPESAEESIIEKRRNGKEKESPIREAKEEPKDESIWSKFVSVVSFK